MFGPLRWSDGRWLQHASCTGMGSALQSLLDGIVKYHELKHHCILYKYSIECYEVMARFAGREGLMGTSEESQGPASSTGFVTSLKMALRSSIIMLFL